MDEGSRANTAALTDPTASTNHDAADDFFDFGGGETPAADAAVNAADKKCANYFGDQDTYVTMLSRYPNVKGVFIRYNTTLPLSAPVKCLFSIGRQMEVTRRSCLNFCHVMSVSLLRCCCY